MPKISLENLGTIVRRKRGDRGLRSVAAEIGVSAPTLSRIESGKMPDLQTFGKLCNWLQIDPASLLGIGVQPEQAPDTGIAAAHLRANREISHETASALARLIVRAQQILADEPREPDGKRV